MIQVYTGDGKGKTTAAIGLAVRAHGHGLRVAVFQFLKTDRENGEARVLRQLGILCRQYGSGRWLFNREPDQEELALAAQGLADAEWAVTAGYQVVILDEISHAVNLGLLPEEKVRALAANIPAGVELILTGREMPETLRKMADLVTEMQAVKHPYTQGIGARRGIEY
ncbi:MAG TPA: cob(I)yrinic acid a,c-diamide adenosyltransferase [Firmicutes bacterium]|uniref:Cob(I)yrinic acid a,c-diamide adenosyltransferase n=1 Tax=Capillibacterium thermochitinicola TaxID=2699427 RepID=A0A8J6I284_9FIRM|nr:cob(I)yrinic acid a,c-diamide adenosyltransferase [Capillibacterium thermochitinicola]MBA2134066.1 cob(I)yrinic acid a,c-diamide adenosyltransferase [Capillibacterium thermochitinicola]HHW12876.1 cob(I)yrinic acid a,c-diamide adenosyltransferase [Bacillota bacterium]